jgi:hypothetical protein
MTASIPSLTVPNSLTAGVKKKRVLLVDTSRAKRDVRAETMRRLGMEVDCAADISEARGWWRPKLYDLVLFHVEYEVPHMYKFWDDILAATPEQQVAFLVGKPGYLAPSPAHAPREDVDAPDAMAPPSKERSSIASLVVSERWGILEACQRISAVRSVADARTRALRDRPLPPREAAPAETRRMLAEVEISAEAIGAEVAREEMQ